MPPPADEPFPWLLLPLVVTTFSTAILLMLLDYRRDRLWVGRFRRRLGRRGLVWLAAAFLTSTGGGGLCAVVTASDQEVSTWKRCVIYVAGPLMIGAGGYFAAAAALNRPRQLNLLTQHFYPHLPDVPLIPEPPPPPPPLRVPPAEQPFLTAITASPDDDLHRLVYADWLDERDDPRGKYLRLEIEANRGDEAAELHRIEMMDFFDPAWVCAVRRPVGFRDDSDEPESA